MSPSIRRSGKARLGRAKRSRVCHTRSSQGSRGHWRSTAFDRFAVDEGVPRGRGNSTPLMCISIVEIVLINVVYRIDVRDSRVRDVYVVYVHVAAVIPGMKRFAPT